MICRHIHAVVYNPAERAFYACTGDIDRGHGNECHWLRGTYDARADTWDWKVLVSVNSNSRFKSGGINFVDGRLYWVADANGPKRTDEAYDRGIFRCAPADLADPQKHTLLFNPEFELANMIIEDGVILAGHCARRPPMPPASSSRRTWARPGRSTTWPSSGRGLPFASNRKTATAGSASICEKAGSSARRSCSSNRRPRSETARVLKGLAPQRIRTSFLIAVLSCTRQRSVTGLAD